ncbi:MAG: peptidoglycan-binding protein [Clostridia bacterium]|nr:peptidoglycan-binding protein [Clostridia bacterium]
MGIFKEGDIGPNVELIQSTLKKLGFYNGEIDGVFGIKTKEAVIRFQREFGLTVDGIVGTNTWNRLLPYINGYSYYVINQGDTLYSIARRFNANVNYILTANPNINVNNLIIGEMIIVPFNTIVKTDISYTYKILELNISALRTVYPFLEFGSIGRSILGRDIPYIRIGRGTKQVLYNASIHANEWITSVLVMKFVENFSRAYVMDRDIFGYRARDLFEECSLYIVPMMNPDGVDIVTGYIRQGSSVYDDVKRIADRYPNIAFPSGWKANIKGVDLKSYQPVCKVL